MSETTVPVDAAQAIHAVIEQPAKGRPGDPSTAASALNIAHKRPTPGSPSAAALAAGVGPTPDHNLRFRGGRTIPDLTYVNLYVGGQAAWSPADIANIDRSLAGAMTDQLLNGVIQQYFPGPITTTAAPSKVLPGKSPKKVTRATVDTLVQTHVVQSGLLGQFDPANTVFNFLLPPRVVLTTDGGAQETSDEATGAPSVTNVTTI